MTTHRQRNHGRGTLVPIRTDILLSVRPLTRCPLAARPLGLGRQLPSRGHCNSTRNLRSGRAWNRPPFIKVRHSPTGNTCSPMTHYCSHMPTLTRIGNKAAPTTTRGCGNLCLQSGSLASAGPILQNSPVCRPRPPSLANVHESERGIHRSLGPPRGPLTHVATTDPAFAGHPLGSTSMGL